MRRHSRRTIKLVVLVAVVIVIVQIYNIEVDENTFSRDPFPPQNRALASNDLVLSTESSRSPWDFTSSVNAIMSHTPNDRSSDLEETDVENFTQDNMKISDHEASPAASLSVTSQPTIHDTASSRAYLTVEDDNTLKTVDQNPAPQKDLNVLYEESEEISDHLNVIEQELKKEDNAAILTEVNGTSHQTTKPTQANTAYQALQKRLDVLFKESKDVFDLLPKKYLPDYKSFCWYDMQNIFQCLASVYLAGMPKCGTTDLFDKLMWHPELTSQSHHLLDIKVNARRTEKEYHYWTRGRICRPKNFLLNPRVPPPKTPFSEFLNGSGAERVKSYKDRRIVDGTPSLLWDLGGWETRYPGLDEPPYSNADLIHAVTPYAKILAILRNPTDRLYSEYIYFWKGSKMRNEVRSPQTFHMDVRRETTKFNRCLESNSLRNCCYSSGYSLRLRVALGVYICYIRDFLEVFGDNFLVLTINEYHSNPINTLTKIFDHIGIYKPNTEEWQLRIETSETLNENGDTKEEVGEMLDETRELLNQFYGPHNSELAVFLKDSQYLFA